MMQAHILPPTAGSIGGSRPGDWLSQVIALLDAARSQLEHEDRVQDQILEATSLLRTQVKPSRGLADGGKERLLAWQARKVLDYIDANITSRVLVTDLSTLVRRSEAHFSRSFKRTFGYSPHAFVIRRRVELAMKCMLDSDMSLTDIAIGCGFSDQAHLCRHFRLLTGETPAAWRRVRKGGDSGFDALDPPARVARGLVDCVAL